MDIKMGIPLIGKILTEIIAQKIAVGLIGAYRQETKNTQNPE